VLGVWAPAIGSVTGTPVWRASYPAGLEAGAAGLDAARSRLATADPALHDALIRLDAFAARRGKASDAEAYGLEAEAAAPERDLSLLLQEMRTAGVPRSYEAEAEPAGRWDGAVEAFQGLIQRLERIVADGVWVETRIGGQLVAETCMGWMGDAETVAPNRPNPQWMALHLRTVELALASRQALLRTFALALASAVKLSVLAATPGGFVLALPAVWRFITQVRIEWRKRVGGGA
jgi:hypothetical protein